MAYSEDYEAQLRQRWEARGRVMPESNLRQAEYPDGATMIPNPKGSAPGLQMRIDDVWVFAVPGVPAEMLPMLDEEILPFLHQVSGDPAAVVMSRLVRSWGLSESRVGEMLSDLFDRHENPTIAFLASSGEIKVRLTAKAADPATAAALIAPVEEEIVARLGSHVFGFDDDTIERVILRELQERDWSIATAESATGGLIAARLTSIPGSSASFRGSVVAYHEDVKRSLLGVPGDVIAGDGVVSEATALAMAEGGATALGADVAVAVTGSAGPDPQEQAVGTMIVAVHTPEETRARTMRLPGDRERVRTYTTTAALQLTRLAIEGKWWGDDGQAIWGVRPGGDR
jgi:nicotinamide-nucleotide amidase